MKSILVVGHSPIRPPPAAGFSDRREFMRSPLLAGALVALALGAATAAAAADGHPTTTYADALAQAQQQNKILVIDFYTDW
jgi:Mrp family chromosome partitioning ATPase